MNKIRIRMPKKKIQEVKEGNTDTRVQSEQSIEQLFGSKTRVRMLRLFLDNPDRAFYVRELTRRIDAQLNSVRRELNNLIGIGILKETKGVILKEEDKGKKGKSTKKKFYQANSEFAFFEELRGIMKKSAVLMNRGFVEEITKKGNIHLLFLTGTFIDNPGTESDMLVVGDIKPDDLRKAVEKFEKEIGREINYTSMPKDELVYRMEVKDRFLQSLLKTDKVILINDLDLDI